MLTGKKMPNLKVENSVLFSRHTEDLSLKIYDLSQETASQIALRVCSEDVSEEPGYLGHFAKKSGRQNIKRSLLIKETRHLKLMNLAPLNIWQDARIWAHLESFH